MKITIENYKPPEGVKLGDEFTAMATIVLGEDGSYDLTAIDDSPVGGEADEELTESGEAEAAMPPQDPRKISMPWQAPPA